MYICDCHCDTLNKIYKYGGNLYQNDYQFDVKRLIRKGNGMEFLAIQIPKGYSFNKAENYTRNLMNIYLQQLYELKKHNIKVKTLKCKNDILKLKDYNCNFLLCIEDGVALGNDISLLEEYYDLGIRAITLTWSFKNQIATGINDIKVDDGLTKFGKKVICKMNELGMLIDVSHISIRSFWDVMEYSTKPIIASHSNVFSKCNHHRNLRDDQIRAISDKEGIIGINLYPKFLNNNYLKANIEDVYSHIDYILNLVGDKCIALGTDFDGMDISTYGLKSYETIYDLINFLYAKNYSKKTMDNIFSKNAFNLLRKVLL